MPQKRPDLERQITQANEALAAWVKVLEENGVSPKDRRRDPKWRTLNATRRQLTARLNRVAETETLNEESVRRKAEKAAGGGAEKAQKKKKDNKKDKKKPQKKGEKKEKSEKKGK